MHSAMIKDEFSKLLYKAKCCNNSRSCSIGSKSSFYIIYNDSSNALLQHLATALTIPFSSSVTIGCFLGFKVGTCFTASWKSCWWQFLLCTRNSAGIIGVSLKRCDKIPMQKYKSHLEGCVVRYHLGDGDCSSKTFQTHLGSPFFLIYLLQSHVNCTKSHVLFFFLLISYFFHSQLVGS